MIISYSKHKINKNEQKSHKIINNRLYKSGILIYHYNTKSHKRRNKMLYLLLAASVGFAVLNNILYHKMGSMGSYHNFFFTALSSIVWLVILAPGADHKSFLSVEILFGVIYGSVQAMFLFFKMKAMSSGPVSVTSVVSNCSMVLTILLGILIFNENVSVPQMLGAALILLSGFLCVDPKADMKMTLRWKLYCVGFFIFAAAVGVIFKLFSASDGNGSSMMIVSAVTMVALLMLLSFVIEKKPKLNGKQALFALACGVLSCGYNRINLYLSGALPSVVFFPVFNGSIVLLSSLSGKFIFKEKLSKKQISGIILGICAIIILGIK